MSKYGQPRESLLALAVVLLVGCSEKAPSQQSKGASTQASQSVNPVPAPDGRNTREGAPVHSRPDTSTTALRARLQLDEFSFVIPGGWSSIAPDRTKTKAMLLLGGTRWDNAKGMIKIDVGVPTCPTVQETADSFARGGKGRVSPDAVNVDGEKGVRVATSSRSMSVPREVVVIYRNGKVYLVMAGALDGTEVSEALEQVLSTWKWADR